MFNLNNNQLRKSGVQFDGLYDPIQGIEHCTNPLSQSDIQALQTRVGEFHLAHFGAIYGSLNQLGRTQATAQNVLKASLQALLATQPSATSYPEYYQKFVRSYGSSHVVRIVGSPTADINQIPLEYHDRFLFVGIDTPQQFDIALGKVASRRPDGLFNRALYVARRLAASDPAGESTLTHFDTLIETALADAQLTLEPALSMAPTEDDKNCLRLVAYILLAREEISPDGVFGLMNALGQTAPLNYYTSENRTLFKQPQGKNLSGLRQLIFEGLLFAANSIDFPAHSFEATQKLLDARQFLEDLGAIITRVGGLREHVACSLPLD